MIRFEYSKTLRIANVFDEVENNPEYVLLLSCWQQLHVFCLVDSSYTSFVLLTAVTRLLSCWQQLHVFCLVDSSYTSSI